MPEIQPSPEDRVLPVNDQLIQLETTDIGKGHALSPGVITEKHLLFFGGQVLSVIAVLMLLAAATYLFADSSHQAAGREIFEFAKTALPPIATLILGFYFRGARRGE